MTRERREAQSLGISAAATDETTAPTAPAVARSGPDAIPENRLPTDPPDSQIVVKTDREERSGRGRDTANGGEAPRSGPGATPAPPARDPPTAALPDAALPDAAREDMAPPPSAQPEPGPGETATGWRRAWRDYSALLLVDHGIFREIYLNLHRVGAQGWRSAQPAPRHLRRVRRLGVKTVVNLRGAAGLAPERMEIATCRALGLAYREVKLRSRDAPKAETIAEVAALLDDIAYPALFHCKAGADRAGLMSALYLLLRENADVATAKRQLSLRFGHVASGPTGAIDAFLDAAEAAERAAHAQDAPFDFLSWSQTEYDREAVMARFRSSRWGSMVVDRILRRE